MVGQLTFIIPVRHQNSIADWDSTRERIGATLRSIAAQDDPRWKCIVVANRGAVLPPTDDDRIRICRVDLPLPALPDPVADRIGYEEAVRADKGRRILHGLMLAQPRGHVMAVDYDDLVSCRLTGLVTANPGAPGWYVETGYLYDGQGFLFQTHDFKTLCGTSIIVRADLLNLPAHVEEAEESWLRRMLGTHLFLPAQLAERGTPLADLPFPGAIYRVGHAETTSRSQAVLAMAFSKVGRRIAHPRQMLQTLAAFRRLSKPVRAEFFGKMI